MVSVPAIGIYSSTQRQGKTTLSHMLGVYGYQRKPFAEPLKKVVRFLLAQVGLPPAEIDRLMVADKEEAISALGDASTRRLCQTLGTDWGRTMIHADIWLNQWATDADRTIASGGAVTADDMRFPAEAAAIRQRGGILIQVIRPNVPVPISANHSSEGNLDDFDFDYTLINDGDIRKLRIDSDTMLRKLGVVNTSFPG